MKRSHSSSAADESTAAGPGSTAVACRAAATAAANIRTAAGAALGSLRYELNDARGALMGLDVAQATSYGDLPCYQLMQDYAKAVHVSLQPRRRHSRCWVCARLNAMCAGMRPKLCRSACSTYVSTIWCAMT